jgi:hypothetical protein
MSLPLSHIPRRRIKLKICYFKACPTIKVHDCAEKKPWPMGFGTHLRKGMSIKASPIIFFLVRSFHVIDEPQQHHGATCQ